MSRFIDRGYTDWCAIIGVDFDDAMRFHEFLKWKGPEFLLGYSVVLCTLDPKTIEGLNFDEFFLTTLASYSGLAGSAIDSAIQTVTLRNSMKLPVLLKEYYGDPENPR